MPAEEVAEVAEVADELAGLDLLELGEERRPSTARRLWSLTWPKLAAVVIGIGIWQAVVWSGWKPEHALAPPSEAFGATAASRSSS